MSATLTPTATTFTVTCIKDGHEPIYRVFRGVTWDAVLAITRHRPTIYGWTHLIRPDA